MPEQTDELIASYHRCRASEGFIDAFYDIFLSKSPEIAQKFSQTDFTIQKLMLRESLLEMLCFDRGLPGTRGAIETLGRRHQQLEVTSEMYAMWLDSLCEAVRQHDPEYSAELEQRWREAMQKGIAVMASAYESGDDSQ